MANFDGSAHYSPVVVYLTYPVTFYIEPVTDEESNKGLYFHHLAPCAKDDTARNLYFSVIQ